MLTVRAGQNYQDGGSWNPVDLHPDGNGRIERVQVPVEVKPNAVVALKGRRGWEWQVQAVAEGQWPGTHQPAWDTTTARWTLPGETIEAQPFPEGVILRRVFTDSARLALYGGVFLYRLTHSGLTGKGKAAWNTPDGPLLAQNAIAWAEADTVYGYSDTVRVGGKTYLGEIFPALALAALSDGGRVVTVDPTITVSVSTGSTDGILDEGGPNLDYGGYSVGVVGMSTSPTRRWHYVIHIGRESISPYILDGGVRIISATLTLTTGLAYATAPARVAVYALTGSNSSFYCGTSAGAGTGGACWAFRNYDTSAEWTHSQGLVGESAKVATFTPSGTLAATHTFSIPPNCFLPNGIALMLADSDEVSAPARYWYPAQADNPTPAYRPTLTLQLGGQGD